MVIKNRDGVQLYDSIKITWEGVLALDIEDILEDLDYYYVRPMTDDPYDELWYVLDKTTRKVYWAYFIELDIEGTFGKAKHVNLETLKRVS